ncbi:YggT family protein [Carnobacterium alterfunditum]|uniref:YggT family protein n=2 Tax=Carnobacterium TaxID=2747 RepID=A0A1N6GI33_9LACT|nr:YggT family protein [Carnobacterium alterfunditum]MBT2732816.1 YggT family protein [Carnobacterium sp. ISL-102]SIO07062.1 YggT family protein [Carnobacterium alterfunditum]
MANFISILYTVLSRGLDIYSTLIIVYILMSWFPGAYQSKFGQILATVCEPYLNFFRRFIPPIGMINFSGIVALVVLNLAKSGLFSLFQLIIRIIY